MRSWGIILVMGGGCVILMSWWVVLLFLLFLFLLLVLLFILIVLLLWLSWVSIVPVQSTLQELVQVLVQIAIVIGILRQADLLIISATASFLLLKCQNGILVMFMIIQEDDKGHNKRPMQEVNSNGKGGQSQLHLVIKLRNHGHLTSEPLLIIQPPVSLLRVALFMRIMLAPAIPESAPLHAFFVHPLIPEHRVLRRDRHDLHRKGEHHEDYEEAGDWHGLWKSLPSFDFELFTATEWKEVYTDFDDGEENAD